MTRRFADFSRPAPPIWRFKDTVIVVLASTIAVGAFVGLGLLFLLVRPAGAEWKPQYAEAPKAVRDWYEAQELTPEAQKRFPYKSCCAKSDRVRTKFKVGGSGNDEWWWLSGDTWKRIPADVIHWGVRTPDGDAVLFAIGGEPVCFYPADSGG